MKHKSKGYWIAVLIILVGCTIAALLASWDKDESMSQFTCQALSVETLNIYKTDYRVRIPAWGFVEPQETIDIRPEISGKVAAVSTNVFIGGEVKQGSFLFSIDSRAYENTLSEATAAHEQARQALKIEKGRQAIAISEWKLLESSNWRDGYNKSLALREPQLKTCQAAVQMALARQSQAALDVERSRFTAPCRGVILEEDIAKGQVLDIGDVALRLACTDCYQVVANFSTEYLLDPDIHTAVVEIGPDRHVGAIKAVLPQIDLQTRQKKAVVVFKGKKAVIGAYASMALPGLIYKDCAVLPKAALKFKNTVWVLSKNDTLNIRTVAVLAQDTIHVVIGDGLAEGERVILSHIASPLQGMPLRAVEVAPQN